MEHRWGERLQINVPVRVSAHAFSGHDGRLTNLSVSGAHLETEMELRVGSRVEIVMILPYRSKHEAPAVLGFVTRRNRDGFGLEWCQFAPAAVAELLRNAARHRYAAYRAAAHSMIRPRTAGSLLKHAQ